MKSILQALTHFIILITIQSCNYVEGLYLDGEHIKTEIWIDEFSAIKIETPVQLILEQTSEELATVSGLDFKLQKLKFRVENEILIIESDGFDHSRKDQMATINLPVSSSLSKITMNAPAELRPSGELVLDRFVLTVNGRGTYSESNLILHCKSITVAAFGENVGTHTIEGQADNLSLTMEGLAFIDATKMAALDVTINQRSLKSSYVQALNQLIINMYSSGHVYFSGQPIVEYNAIDPGWNVNFGKAIDQSE